MEALNFFVKPSKQMSTIRCYSYLSFYYADIIIVFLCAKLYHLEKRLQYFLGIQLGRFMFKLLESKTQYLAKFMLLP